MEDQNIEIISNGKEYLTIKIQIENETDLTFITHGQSLKKYFSIEDIFRIGKIQRFEQESIRTRIKEFSSLNCPDFPLY
jgi:hypothetical protein